jgi:hypothetical protein
MKLHGNAALSLKQRQLLVSRVIDDNWSLAKAAAAAEVSEPHGRQVGPPLQVRGCSWIA